MQIQTIRKGFESFEWKFEQFERDRTIRKGFEAFKLKFEPFERDSKHSNANSNHSKGFRSFRIQIRINEKEFEAFENSKSSSNHSKGIRCIQM